MGKPTTFLRKDLPDGTIQPVSGTVGHLTSRKQCRVLSTSGKWEGGLSKYCIGTFSPTWEYAVREHACNTEDYKSKGTHDFKDGSSSRGTFTVKEQGNETLFSLIFKSSVPQWCKCFLTFFYWRKRHCIKYCKKNIKQRIYGIDNAENHQTVRVQLCAIN